MDFPDLMILPYVIAFYKGDRAGMERAAARGKGQPGIGGLDDQHGGIRSGLFRSFAAGQNDDAPRDRPGEASASAGKGGYV